MPRRDEFLQAALGQFSKVGYTAASTREICAELGLVHSAIYNYFPSKEAVVLAIEEKEMLQMIADLQSVIAATRRDPQLQLDAVLTQVFEQAIVRQAAWRLMADMIRSLKPRNKQQVIRRRDEFEGMVRQTIKEAVLAGLLPSSTDVKLASLNLFSLAEGLAGWFRKGGGLSRSEVVKSTVKFALLGMGYAPRPDGEPPTGRALETSPR